MFTKICKTVMWIGIVVCFVLSIVIGMQFRGIEFWVILGGWAATLVIFSSFGMIIEIAENIKKSREILEIMSNTQSAPPVRQTREEVNENTEDINENDEDINEDDDDMWKCSKCKCFNEYLSTFCIYCGAPKP